MHTFTDCCSRYTVKSFVHVPCKWLEVIITGRWTDSKSVGVSISLAVQQNGEGYPTLMVDAMCSFTNCNSLKCIIHRYRAIIMEKPIKYNCFRERGVLNNAHFLITMVENQKQIVVFHEMYSIYIEKNCLTSQHNLEIL